MIWSIKWSSWSMSRGLKACRKKDGGNGSIPLNMEDCLRKPLTSVNMNSATTNRRTGKTANFITHDNPRHTTTWSAQVYSESITRVIGRVVSMFDECHYNAVTIFSSRFRSRLYLVRIVGYVITRIQKSCFCHVILVAKNHKICWIKSSCVKQAFVKWLAMFVLPMLSYRPGSTHRSRSTTSGWPRGVVHCVNKLMMWYTCTSFYNRNKDVSYLFVSGPSSTNQWYVKYNKNQDRKCS